MEIKINKEIRDYTETMFFGLSARQFFFSLAALAVAVVLYLSLKPLLGTETTSWVCILGAAPFAIMGFVKYHGMSAEKFLWVWIRSELLEPKQLKCCAVNYYYEACREPSADLKAQKRKKQDSGRRDVREEDRKKGIRRYQRIHEDNRRKKRRRGWEKH